MRRGKRFELHRDRDATGISGTGIVAEGIEFYDGACALRWRSEHKSSAFYESMACVEAIHGHGGQTRIVWIDQKALPPVWDEEQRRRVSAFVAYELREAPGVAVQPIVEAVRKALSGKDHETTKASVHETGKDES